MCKLLNHMKALEIIQRTHLTFKSALNISYGLTCILVKYHHSVHLCDIINHHQGKC